jgi:hypothetical protein
MSAMRTALALGVAALAVAAVPGATQAKSLTTKPGVIYVLKVPVDDKGIHVPKDQFTRNGITRYPRGAEIRYEFTNKGTKPYAVHLWAVDTIVMKPGGHSSMFVNWQYRGDYHYWRILRGHRISPVGTIIIF